VAHAAPSRDDWEYCRAVLPRVSRTFAINIRVLGDPLARAVRIAYLLCRSCDALEDSWPGTPRETRERFAWLDAAVRGDAAAAARLADGARARDTTREDLALLTRLPAVLRCFGALDQTERLAIEDCLAVMSRGMCAYAARYSESLGAARESPGAARPAAAAGEVGSAGTDRGVPGPPARAYLETESELHDYCWVVAGSVGVMLTRLFSLLVTHERQGDAAGRLERAPRMGEALQLTNILLDWPGDVRRGRCYMPAAWLAEFGLSPRDLVDAPRDGQREILDRLERLARRALAVVPEYLARVPAEATRYRLFCLWPALWAAASIGRARRDAKFPWGPERPRIGRARLWSLAAGSALAPGAFNRAFRPPAR
jgi:farnesyl-diphosphate farnesyltransferase